MLKQQSSQMSNIDNASNQPAQFDFGFGEFSQINQNQSQINPNETIENLQNELRESKQSHADTSQMIQEKDRQLQELQAQLIQQRSSAESERNIANQLQIEVDQHKRKYQELRDENEDKSKVIEDMKATMQTDKDRISNMEKELQELRQKALQDSQKRENEIS